MKVAELKAELAALRVDTRACIEKSDLVEALVKARAAKKAAPEAPEYNDGRTYGTTAVVGNEKNPTGLVVFSHGLGDTCAGWASNFEDVARRFPHLLFVFPTAPTQPVTMNGGMRMTSWYDIKAISFNAAEDVDGMVTSARKLVALATEYGAKHNIPMRRVVFGGFSQGAVISFHAGLTCAEGRPAGVIALSGYLGGREHVAQHAKHADIPIFMAHGQADPLVPLMLSQGSKQVLEAQVNASQLEYKVYPGMQHSACPQELADMQLWLGKTVRE